MKKVVLLILSIAILMCFIACNEQGDHVHQFGEWSTTKNATCTEDGIMVRYCSCGENQTKAVPMTGHTEEIDAAISATCTGTGLTEGKHCSTCGETLVAQQETSAIAHAYDNNYDRECNSCGCKRDVECPHDEIEVIESKSATCDEKGLTEGTKCKKCGEILTAQSIIPELEHNETEWIVDKEPTKYENGKRHTECTGCGQIVKEEILYANGSVGLNYTLKSDGESYFVSDIGTCTDTDIVIPSTYNGLPVTSIGGNAFKNQNSLQGITIPESVTSIAGYAFYNCDSLSSITIPNSVTNIGDYAFYSCDLLSSITMPNSVTNIGDYAFAECKSITSIVIPESVVHIGNSAFTSCDSIASIIIPNSVANIGSSAFYDCDSLANIFLPNSVTSIGSNAFNYCPKLDNVYYAGKLEDWLSISFEDAYANPLFNGAKLFFDGELVADIIIPESITSIGRFAFYGCSSLTSVTISDSVTSIGKSAFCCCYSLAIVKIPDSITSMDDYVFYNCDSLTIYCEVTSRPNGWSSWWNYSDRFVVWGYTEN